MAASSLVVGCLIGALFSVANLYMGLKTGWWDGGTVTAVVLAYVLLTPLSRTGAGTTFTPHDNVVAQTAACSAATMPAVIGLLGAVPALLLDGLTYSPFALVAWGVALAVLGLVVSLFIRKSYIVDDPLPFPDGRAAAEVIDAMHRGKGAGRRGAALLGSTVVSMIVTWLRDGKPAWIPQAAFLPVRIAGSSAQSLGIGLSYSPMLLAAGALVGTRNALSVFAGALVAWGVIAPRLIRAHVVAGDFSSLVSWLLWPGVALIITGGLGGVLSRWRQIARAGRDLFQRPSRAGRALWLAAVISALAVLLLAWRVFGVSPLLGLLALIVSIPLTIMCTRVGGETDIVPLGTFGQLVQSIFALAAPGSSAANIACGSIVAGDTAQTMQSMESFKTGHLVSTPLRRQVIAQLAGVGVGTAAAVPAYALLKRAYPIGSAAMPAPAALTWKAIGDLSRHGLTLPHGAGLAVIVAGAVGLALGLCERTRAGRILPTAVCLGTSFIIPASMAATLALGGVAVFVFKARRPALADERATSMAAGGIAGEALVGLVIALLIVLGLLTPN